MTGKPEEKNFAGVSEIISKINTLPALPAGNDPNTIMAINGQINPTFAIQPGEVQRWRVVDASWDQQQLFQWYQSDGTTMKTAVDMNFYEIALDGLATGRMIRSPYLMIAPGQRSDVLIKAPTIPAKSTKTYVLVRTENGGLVGSVNNGPVIVATLNVCGEEKRMNLPTNLESLARCRPFTSIPDSELVPATLKDQNGNPTDTLTFNGQDPQSLNPPPGVDFTTGVYTLNGKTFHNWTDTLKLQLGTAQEWTLNTKTNPNTDTNSTGHPFHIHVNPFHVLSYTDSGGQIIPMDVWRDTLYIPAGASYTIRHRFRDWPGKSVIHCHILDHEDQGMMLPIELVPAGAKPANKAAAALTPMNLPAPNVVLADPTGTGYKLAESRGKKVVLVFFKGMQCAHCTDDLRSLLKDARAKAGEDAQIVAVSARKISDQAVASRMLGVVARDKFRLLVDESHTTFKAYGCVIGDEPQHGLFLIDRAGVIRSGYVGETPFGDSAEVFARLRRMASAGPRPPG